MNAFILEDDHRCFACGMENPDGLRIEWRVEGQAMTGEFVPTAKYQGWKGIVHGGILATLLDEAMTRLAGIVCGAAVTAEMTVRYLKPAKIGEKLDVRGEVVKEQRKLVELRAFIYQGGVLVAQATGKAIKV